MHFAAFVVLLLPTAIQAVSVAWRFGNNQIFANWGGVIQSCLDIVADISDNNIVTILVPGDPATTAFVNSPAYQGASQDTICELAKYHIIQGFHLYKDIVAAGPFLKTMYQPPGLTEGQRVLVTGSPNPGAPESVIFYSGLGKNSSIEQTVSNILAGTSVMHVIDTVLTIPMPMFDTAISAGLTSYAGALTTINADLDTVQDATFFVPTNDAFETVGSVLTSASNDELQNILEYHYLNDTDSNSPRYTSQISSAKQQTSEGTDVTLSYNSQNELFVDSAAVTYANILVDNGVAHVIDQVLNPNASSKTRPAGSIGTPAFTDASRSRSPPFVNVVDGAQEPETMDLAEGPVETPYGPLAPGYRAQKKQIEESAGTSIKGEKGTIMLMALGIMVACTIMSL